MMNSISTKILAVMAVGALLLTGCDRDDKEKPPAELLAASADILKYIPADSPYVFATLAPLPDDVMLSPRVAPAVFGHAPGFEYHDLIGTVDRAQAVGDDDGGPILQQLVNGALDAPFGGRIEPRRRLVQDDEAGVTQENTREGQELRFARQSDRLFYQFGLFYFDEDFDLLNQDFLNPAASALVNQKTTSTAVFGQAEYSLNDRWAVTVGGRYTDDDKDLTVDSANPGGSVLPGAISVSDSFFNWDVAVTWDMNDDWTWYGRLATGSRGPVTLGRFGFVSSADTEDSTALELGFKASLMDGRARWNTAVYTFRNDDHQLTATGGAANVNQLLNADQVNGQGIETEFDLMVTENLFVAFNLSYNDTEIDDPGLRDDLCGSAPSCTGLDEVAGMRDGPFGPVTEVFIDGNPLPRTPKWIANFILQYTYPIQSGELYFNTDWNYRDDSNLFLHRSIEFIQEERVLGGLRAGYRMNNGVDLAVVGRNITDEVAVDGALNFLNLTAFVNEPAYWGVELLYNF